MQQQLLKLKKAKLTILRCSLITFKLTQQKKQKAIEELETALDQIEAE